MRPDRVVIGADDRQRAADPRGLYAPLYLIETPFVITNVETRRADQVRLERLPRHQDLVHQRDREPVRGARRRRPRGRARHGPRPPHRLEVPARRPRLRRLLLPEGHARRWCRSRAEPACASRSSRRWSRSTSASARAWSRRSTARSAATSRGKTDRRARALVQAGHRRHARVAGARRSCAGLQRARRARARLRSGGDGGRSREAARPERHAAARTPTRRRGGADALVIVTEWNQFRMLDLERLKSRLEPPVIVDLRNVYDPAAMRRAGFRYVSLGRPEAAGEVA